MQQASTAAPQPPTLGDIWPAVEKFGLLMEVQEACFCLGDLSRSVVERALQHGALRGVDIGLGKTQRSLRVYRYSVEQLLNGAPPEKIAAAAILPHSRPDLLVRELAQLFACTTQHVYNLSAAGEIVPPVRVSSIPRFTRESVIAFLERREIRGAQPQG